MWSQTLCTPILASVMVPGGCCSQGCHGYLPCSHWQLPQSFQAPSLHLSIVDEFNDHGPWWLQPQYYCSDKIMLVSLDCCFPIGSLLLRCLRNQKRDHFLCATVKVDLDAMRWPCGFLGRPIQVDLATFWLSKLKMVSWYRWGAIFFLTLSGNVEVLVILFLS